MPIQCMEEDAGKILAVHVSGKLTRADYENFVPEFERNLRQQGKVHMLFEMTGLDGWDVGAAWEDIKFDIKHFSDIDRLAMVGDKKWEQYMTTICKSFTRATTRYFDEADAEEARQWLVGC